MRNLKLQGIVTLVICLLGNTLFAQQHLRFEKFIIEDGLTSINCILQDTRGFIWFGGTHGLYRFDGYDYTIYNRVDGDASSLSSDNVIAVAEDNKGNIWIGTERGLNKFDPRKEKFTRFDGTPLDHVPVTDITEDAHGNLWIATRGEGIFILNESSHELQQFRHIPSIPTSLSSDEAFSLLRDSSGNMWVATNSGYLDRFDPEKKSFNHFKYYDGKYSSVRTGQRMIEDSFKNIWIGTEGDGLYKFNPATQSFQHFIASNAKGSLSGMVITDLAEREPGEIWLSMDGNGGLNQYDSKTGSFAVYRHDPYDRYSITNNSSYCLFIDYNKTIWLGMGDGVVNRSDTSPFTLYQPSLDPQKNSLSFRVVVALAADKKNTLWIGTGGQGLDALNLQTTNFKNYRYDPNKSSSIQSDIVLDVCADAAGNIWTGTFMGGLNKLNPITDDFEIYRHSSQDPGSLTNDHVFDVLEDHEGSIWVATQGGGLDRLKKDSKQFDHFRHDPSDPVSISSDRVISLFEDSDFNLWVGTIGGGLQRFDPKTETFQSIDFPDNTIRLSDFAVHCIYENSKGQMIIGTGGAGVILFDKGIREVVVLSGRQGLPSNSVYGIIEDCNNNLWFSTNKGIARFDQRLRQFQVINTCDGLPSNDFESGSILKTRDCRLFFGSKNGIVSFFPDNVFKVQDSVQVTLTALRMFNQVIKPNDQIENVTVLKEAISLTKALEIPYHLDNFSIEFAVTGSSYPGKIKYRYRLKGLDDRWIETGANRRIATYSNLWEGSYTFEVQAANAAGVWSNKITSLPVIISPPWWRSPGAYVAYGIVFLMTVMAFYKAITYKIRLQNQLTLEKYRHEKDKELYLHKIELFTSISHELRTPLTLILGPLERLVNYYRIDGRGRNQLLIIQRNAHRLLHYVNQLLDFRKIESGKLKLQVAEGNVLELIDEIALSFKDLAFRKNINFSNSHNSFMGLPVYDANKLEIMVNNLVSNAFRYTPPYGSVSIHVNVLQKKGKNFLEISVSDTGKGIPENLISKIFDPFFRIETNYNLHSSGTGLGLAMVKDLASLHRGSVEVKSEIEKGTTFVLTIPCDINAYHESEIADSVPDVPDEPSEVNQNNAQPQQPSDDQRPVLLIAEDNTELREFIAEGFKNDYEVVKASDGREAYEAAIEKIPDLIISDVMMPEMDGIELSKKLKSDERTSHIPVVLLTARTAVNHKLEGLETGIDDYVTKPFSFDLLSARVLNLIESRRKLRERFSRQVVLKPKDVVIGDTESNFLERVIGIIENHIADPGFTIGMLTKDVGMSQSVLYRKIQALTGMSPNDFIKHIRLQRAMQLMQNGNLSISQISDMVGFSSPKYFSTCFKAEFNKSPSEYLNRKTNNRTFLEEN